MNYFKWTALGVGGVVAVAHIGVLGHLLGTTKDLAMRPQYPNINLPTGQYSSYNVDVNREGYSIRYNANDPKVLQRTTTLDLDKQHNNSGLFGKTSTGREQRETFVQEQYTMDGHANLQGGETIVGDDGKKLTAAEIRMSQTGGSWTVNRRNGRC